MDNRQKVSAYIKKHEKWTRQLEILRTSFNNTELQEEWKWGAPAYSLNGKLVAGFSAFKDHCAIWFFQGVFLSDPKNVLINAQKGVTKALRQWRFSKNDNIDPIVLSAYIDEAISNCKAGKEIKPVRNMRPVVLPEELVQALNRQKGLMETFKKLTPGKQREYATYIASAKQPATRLRRLDKIIPLIIQGVGLNDRYR